MSFDYILLIIVFFFLRKTLQSKIIFPKIDTYLFLGFWLSIVLLIAGTILNSRTSIFSWIAHLMSFGLIYFCLTQNEFKPVKSFIYSILPFVAISFLEDFTELINASFHDEWNDYFETGISFSIIWFFAMFFINKKQRKDIVREQLKAIESEKEFQQSEVLKAKLEIQVVERTAELLGQKEELQKALDVLKTTQVQLIQSEKMASLGELTAGIAHEIQNPLNFVNNFSEVSSELLDEMIEEIEKGDFDEVKAIANDIKQNLLKINHHGKRADAIVKGMLQHSRSSSAIKEPTDINKLADEYLRLSYHGLRAKDKSFNATMNTEFDESIGNIEIIPQDIGRVILNLITNAFYATYEKQKSGIENYEPTVTVSTKKVGSIVEIFVKDNGNGIPKKLVDKIFQPFFTTKPTGQGTGLGLSLSYDIVKVHGGEIKIVTEEGKGATFIISLPLKT
jgi:two-component system NtrC family sensor kinase